MNTSLTVAETVDSLVHAEFARAESAELGASSRGSSAAAEQPGRSFDLDKARLYVMPLADDASTDHIVLVDEDENPYRLLRRTRHHAPVLAGCLVATGWCAPFGLDDEACAVAPSNHPERQRVRLTVAVTDEGIASVLRRSDQPDVVHPLPSRGMGDLPDVLEAWWHGC